MQIFILSCVLEMFTPCTYLSLQFLLLVKNFFILQYPDVKRLYLTDGYCHNLIKDRCSNSTWQQRNKYRVTTNK